jgi:hypothetical protein
MKKAIINSLPKSGTNLLGHCLELLGYERSGHIGAGMVMRNDWKRIFRRLASFPVGHGYIVGVDTPIEVSRKVVNRRVLGTGPGTFLTAHVGYTNGVLEYVLEHGFQPMLITRDPRAILNSFVHYVIAEKRHILHDTLQGLSSEEQYLSVLRGVGGSRGQLQPLQARCLAVEVWRKHAEVHHLKFEDLVGPKGGGTMQAQSKSVQQVCEVLNADQNRVRDVTENLFGAEKHTFRKGKVSSWKREIPDSILPIVEEELTEVISMWDYD